MISFYHFLHYQAGLRTDSFQLLPGQSRSLDRLSELHDHMTGPDPRELGLKTFPGPDNRDRYDRAA